MSCKTRTVRFVHDTKSGTSKYMESFDDGLTWSEFSTYKQLGIDPTVQYARPPVWENSGDSRWGMPHTLYVPDDWEDPYNLKTETKYYCSNHDWIDTGMRKVYCKNCDADGELDPMTGKVTVIFKQKDSK